MFKLGVPAQAQLGLYQKMSGAVVLSAVSFLFFCQAVCCRRAFTQKTKKDATAITHANLIILKSYILKIQQPT